MSPQVLDCNPAINSLEALDQAIYRIKACSSETEVDALLRPLLRYFEIDSYVFISLRRDQANRESFRYLIGCTPAWSQIYNAKKWFVIDPFIQYALHNSAPIVGSAIKPETAGQSELLEAAAANGFKSSMIIPTHAGNRARIGVLCLGSPQPPEIGDAQLLRSRNFLRAIAMELFEWWDAKLAAEMLDRYQLDQVDLELLKLEQNGFTAEDAAKVFGQTKSQINGRFRRINDKLDVHHKKHAVKRAIEIGILRG
jgi:DNA-binding CsgD family transcriptional regulator